MDITYLLWLQDFRNSINDAWTPFMEWVSTFGTRGILFLPAILYWCIDKKKGLFVFYALKISHTINSVVKLTACVYRPWNTGQQDSSCRRCDYYSDRIFVS